MNDLRTSQDTNSKALNAIRDPFQNLAPTPAPAVEAEDLITVDEITTPDLVRITVAKPDGRSVRKNVPKECWAQSSYRKSLIANLCTMLA